MFASIWVLRLIPERELIINPPDSAFWRQRWSNEPGRAAGQPGAAPLS